MSKQIDVPQSLVDEDANVVHRSAPYVAYRRIAIVNVGLVGPTESFVLIDAGLVASAPLIRGACEAVYGKGAAPKAILMTHGHFDHVGALETLAEDWDVPVYAHPLELPYLNGTAAYPPGDCAVDPGLMAKLAPLYPTKPVDVGARLRSLPETGEVPFQRDWRWIHTPGHSVGHVSFWREADRTLIAGDAVITANQESVYGALTEAPEIHGPPRYFTVDWDAARASVEAIAALRPATIVSGHGAALSGPELAPAIEALARRFDEVAAPREGLYLTHPARAVDGTAYRPVQ